MGRGSSRKYYDLDLYQEVFAAEGLYAVDDVLPHCKPEKEAFEKIFVNIGNPYTESCVMVEASMKNIRSAKALGMKPHRAHHREDRIWTHLA